ncbi:MAG TPA: DNA-directed RNA polymerase subunit omega, partial [Nitrospina sp.]|nr:DNA-directed RNA polymerase subunit omega [Nitrospina sp.]
MVEMEMKDTLELVRQAQDVVKSRFLLCILVT